MISVYSAVSRARRRRMRRSDYSLGAFAFCRQVTQKIKAFDTEVREQVIKPIIFGYEVFFMGGEYSGGIALSYSEYAIGMYVRMEITMQRGVTKIFCDEIQNRVHVHTHRFFMEKQSRSIRVDLLRGDGRLIQRFEYAPPPYDSCGRSDD